MSQAVSERTSRRGKIDRSDWPDIVSRREGGQRQSEIAAAYGVSQGTISQVLKRARAEGLADGGVTDGGQVDNAGAIAATGTASAGPPDGQSAAEVAVPKAAAAPRAPEADRLMKAGAACAAAFEAGESFANEAAELRRALAEVEAGAGRRTSPDAPVARGGPARPGPGSGPPRTKQSPSPQSPPTQTPTARDPSTRAPSEGGAAARPQASAATSAPGPAWQDWTSGASARQTGRIKFFKRDRGYGFVIPDDGGNDVFVGRDVVDAAGLGDLEEGDRVSFQPGPGKRGQEAKDIRRIG